MTRDTTTCRLEFRRPQSSHVNLLDLSLHEQEELDPPFEPEQQRLLH